MKRTWPKVTGSKTEEWGREPRTVDDLWKLENANDEIETPKTSHSLCKTQGPEDYFEVNISKDLRVKHSAEISERKETEDLSEASRSTIPLAMVLPAEIPCENPGEIFIILRDEVIGDIVEVEFTSNNKHIRTRPALWSKKVWCMKALDFPAGSVKVDIYCDGVIKATTEIKYHATVKAMECLFRMADPREGLCQNDMEELDDIFTSVFKYEIPYYEFQSLQTKIYPQKEYAHFKELPTLLHCTAKFGLKKLAIHLLQYKETEAQSGLVTARGHIVEATMDNNREEQKETMAVTIAGETPDPPGGNEGKA
ncbi:PREDICTED: B-cell scaffold protein with ankyrin repeats-like [Galeopterus variegatus]|uniref:B-cell scaffold protein with ankyrin repeats-like n=1 Tax=Galeopterus variegatus TaxID=482537 RepID=A0ABM0RA11_GALVR|nr:PREDICTED: B-cell scaffold protein with ankyrin repeats-like [Galeopterus variegatus]